MEEILCSFILIFYFKTHCELRCKFRRVTVWFLYGRGGSTISRWRGAPTPFGMGGAPIFNAGAFSWKRNWKWKNCLHLNQFCSSGTRISCWGRQPCGGAPMSNAGTFRQKRCENDRIGSRGGWGRRHEFWFNSLTIIRQITIGG